VGEVSVLGQAAAVVVDRRRHMFTIRHLNGHGDESLFQAALVIRGSDVRNTNGENWQLEFIGADSQCVYEPIHFGRVYVMNETGQTVAVYHLPDPIEFGLAHPSKT
jgi:hypothetical protein